MMSVQSTVISSLGWGLVLPVLDPLVWLFPMSLVAEFLVYRPLEEIQQRGASAVIGSMAMSSLMKSLRVVETSC